MSAIFPQPIPHPPPFLSLVPKTSTGRLDLLQARALDYFVRDCLALNVSDARQLKKAFGWDEQLSLGLCIRSAPTEVYRLIGCAAVRAEMCDLDAWPAGFYVDDANILRFHLEKRYGLVVPVVRRWVRGLQYYRHAKDEQPRWITSASRPTGSPALASIHVADATSGARKPDEETKAFLVDHTLKAMAVTALHNLTAVAFNGVSLRTLTAQLFDSLPCLRGVVVAMKEPPAMLEKALCDDGLSVTFWKGGELL